MKKKSNRIIATFLLTIMMVTIGIDPLGALISVGVDSGLFEDLTIFGKNIAYVTSRPNVANAASGGTTPTYITTDDIGSYIPDMPDLSGYATEAYVDSSISSLDLPDTDDIKKAIIMAMFAGSYDEDGNLSFADGSISDMDAIVADPVQINSMTHLIYHDFSDSTMDDDWYNVEEVPNMQFRNLINTSGLAITNYQDFAQLVAACYNEATSVLELNELANRMVMTYTSATINKNLQTEYQELKGFHSDVVAHFGTVESQLSKIDQDLNRIKEEIAKAQHNYRVAHLYSLNNSLNNALWRPSMSDVPYAEDYAIITGQFANVYSGYWNTYVSTVNKAGLTDNTTTKRALEILGYDALVRYEGVYHRSYQYLQDTLNSGINLNYLTVDDLSNTDYSAVQDGIEYKRVFYYDADAGQLKSVIASPGNGIVPEQPISNSPTALMAEYKQILIPENDITWLDAVTVLYKALGQEQLYMSSFMVPDASITPETSPAFKGLSNPIQGYTDNGGSTADTPTGYSGYDFYVFFSRSNIITEPCEDDLSKSRVDNIYWNKAKTDGVLPVADGKMLSPMTGSDFWILASKMMQIYGEPVISQDEVDALLQVYGKDYPIQLGVEIADAWAYLMVRGCLNVDMAPTDRISRDDLLSVAMCIADKESRSDYKVIEITLDLSDVMISDGYYPVADLNFTTGGIDSSVTLDYTSISYYDYFLLADDSFGTSLKMNNGQKCNIISLVDTTDSTQFSNPSHMVSGAYIFPEQEDFFGKYYYHIQIPKTYASSIGDDAAVYLIGGYRPSGSSGTSSIQWSDYMIKIEKNALTGGFYGVYNNSGYIRAVDGSKVQTFDELNSKSLVKYNDSKRCGDATVGIAGNFSNSTVLEKLAYLWDTWTTPMYVKADDLTPDVPTKLTITIPSLASGKESTISIGELATVETVSGIGSKTSTYADNETGLYHGTYSMHTGLGTLYRTATFFENELLANSVKTSLNNANDDDDITKLTDIISYKALKTNNIDGALESDFIIDPSAYIATPGTIGPYHYSGSVMYNLESGASETTTYTGDVQYDRQSWLYKYMLAYAPLTSFTPNVYVEQYDTNHSSDSSYTMDEAKDYVDGKLTSSTPLNLFDTNNVFKLSWDNVSNNRYAGASQSVKDKAQSSIVSKSAETDFEFITRAIKDYGLSAVDISNDGKTYTFTTTDASLFASYLSGAEGLGLSDKVADSLKFGTSSDLINANVCTSTIMSRREQILISYDDLVGSGWVVDTFDGLQPTPDDAGIYHLMTKLGEVRVNDNTCMIAIGTTIYNLYDENGFNPTLVYIHQPDVNTTPKVYFDVRCVMGLIGVGFERDENSTTVEINKDSIGAGSGVIYTISAGNMESPWISVTPVNAYNFPDLDVGGYTVNILESTIVDNTSINSIATGEKITYWPGGNNNDVMRLAMSSFFPTANWVTFIRQTNNTSDTKGRVYVWYPRSVFKNGLGSGGVLNDTQVESANVNKFDSAASEYSESNFENSKMGVAYKDCLIYKHNGEESDIREIFQSNLGSKWGTEEGFWYDTSKWTDLAWYDQRTIEAYCYLWQDSSGGFYISPDFACRCFDVTLNSAVETRSPNDSSKIDYGSSKPGDLSWLEKVGFVYNIPYESDFSLEDYFNGDLILPLAISSNGTRVVNYNMDYYRAVMKLGKSTPISINQYGYYLQPGTGLVDYTGTVVEGLRESELDFKKKNGADAVYPIPTNDVEGEEGIVYAPVAPYYYFCNWQQDNVSWSNITSYVTSANVVFWGARRIFYDKVDDNGNLWFYRGNRSMGSSVYPTNDSGFTRVFISRAGDVLVHQGSSVAGGQGGNVGVVTVDDIPTPAVVDYLDKWGMTGLLSSIDNGTSFIITFAFYILPIIGFILMVVLAGISIFSENRLVQTLCDRFIDPVKLLTWGRRDIHNWHMRTVLTPLICLAISFAVFLNGNLIRIIAWIASSYNRIVNLLERL